MNILEENFNGLIETIYLTSVPGLKEQLIELKNAPDESFVDEEEVDW